MKKRIRKFEKEMRNIIKTIYDSNRIPDLKTEKTKEALYECCEQNYVSGITVARTVSGSIHFSVQNEISVTYKGLIFLEEKYPNKRINISLIVSIAALFISLITASLSFLAQYNAIQNTWHLLFG